MSIRDELNNIQITARATYRTMGYAIKIMEQLKGGTRVYIPGINYPDKVLTILEQFKLKVNIEPAFKRVPGYWSQIDQEPAQHFPETKEQTGYILSLEK